MAGHTIILKKFHVDIKKIFVYLFFLYFLYSKDSFYAATSVNTSFASISKYIIVFMACFGFLKTLVSRYFYLDCLLLFVLLCIICMGGFSGGVIFKFMLLFAGIFFVDIYSWEDFKKIYVNIMSFIALYSLCCFLFIKVLINCNFFPIVMNDHNVLYRDFFFTRFSLVPDFLSVVCVWRNYGPFWEPGVYQIYLLLGFIFVAFDKNVDKIKMVIFAITIFTTFSTAGYITFSVVFFAFLLKKGYIRDKVFALSLIVFLIFLLLTNKVFMNMVFSKLASKNHSSSSRLSSLLGGMYITFTNPLGTGPYLFLEKMVGWGYEGVDGNTNGFIQHFAILGVPFGIWYTYRLFGFVKCIENRNIVVAGIIFLAIIMELCNEPLFYSLPFSTILFYKPQEEHYPLGIKKLLRPVIEK